MNVLSDNAQRGRRIQTAGRSAFFLEALRVWSAWMERRRQRWALARLDDALLRDVGLTRHDVRLEVEKPFWRA